MMKQPTVLLWIYGKSIQMWHSGSESHRFSSLVPTTGEEQASVGGRGLCRTIQQNYWTCAVVLLWSVLTEGLVSVVWWGQQTGVCEWMGATGPGCWGYPCDMAYGCVWCPGPTDWSVLSKALKSVQEFCWWQFLPSRFHLLQQERRGNCSLEGTLLTET